MFTLVTRGPRHRWSLESGLCDSSPATKQRRCSDRHRCRYRCSVASCEGTFRHILPSSSLCTLKDARWGICWVNYEALIITLSVIGGAIILSLILCCCCCCRKKKNRNSSLETEKSVREKEERRVRQEERRVQMKSRHDEIRKKYGLFKEDNPYSKFDS
ncbi:pituitary tumor-transforming gene 1 protein-interacting protein-like [Ranitomeya variabilis]|uniref:pituitary tumor-transforming gene 1 protein-interacting protein-like n=1 Tax=Ranitomeya variabilis TaxID=490064 RepID=UPI0040570F22